MTTAELKTKAQEYRNQTGRTMQEAIEFKKIESAVMIVEAVEMGATFEQACEWNPTCIKGVHELAKKALGI